MVKGLYTAASGMMTQMCKQDTIANNIANTNTGGYKKQTAVVKAFPEMLIYRIESQETEKAKGISGKEFIKLGPVGTGACLDEVFTDYSEGTLSRTDNSSDIALRNKDAFIAVVSNNNEMYTRNGSLRINPDGLLTDSIGNPVLSVGDSYILVDGDISIDQNGNIFASDEYIDTLKTVEITDRDNLERIGDGLYRSADPAQVVPLENPDILQGYLENSNVNAVKEMVNLVSVVRAYESLQKVIQAEDEATGIAIQKVGRTV